MTNVVATTQLSGLASRLVGDGLLDEETARKVINETLHSKTSFIMHLVENNILSSSVIAHTAAIHFGVPLLDLNAFDEELFPKSLVSEELLEKHHALPLLVRDKQLFIAISDPVNLSAIHEIKFHTGLNVQAILVEEDKLSNKLENMVSAQADAALGDLSDESLDKAEIASTEETAEKGAADSEVDDAPIVRFINKILLDAIKRRASDIHFEPYEKTYRVRFRMDGILYEMAKPPQKHANRIAARVKVISKLDISERRIPQDGHFRLKLSKNNSIDFRVNTCPTVAGEKIVIRILDPSSAHLGIDQLGYEPFQKELFLHAINKPHGMVLVTGPTGSGKTVSLYTALNILNSTERNVSTVEDPVEINLPGVNQVNINIKAGLTFASALRAFLRQDPDVIMVGEIRDLETAEIAIKAAQTGHLVLSTLHTNSGPETLTRLMNMGVPAFNIASSIQLIIAQRLARRLCEHCKKPVELPKSIFEEEGFNEEEIAQGTIFAAVGCENCTNGYAGRVGLYEVLKISETIGRAIMDGGNSLEILDVAKKEGFQTLHQSGMRKVLKGMTSLEEINRVTTD